MPRQRKPTARPTDHAALRAHWEELKPWPWPRQHQWRSLDPRWPRESSVSSLNRFEHLSRMAEITTTGDTGYAARELARRDAGRRRRHTFSPVDVPGDDPF